MEMALLVFEENDAMNKLIGPFEQINFWKNVTAFGGAVFMVCFDTCHATSFSSIFFAD